MREFVILVLLLCAMIAADSLVQGAPTDGAMVFKYYPEIDYVQWRM